MFGIVSELINQLDEDNVVYRKEVRECLKMVNYVYREFILKQYED